MTQLPKQALLLLVHRIPFPPNKGDKIRSYHLLRHLAKDYQVHLGCFIDDANDAQYIETVRQWCGDTHFASLNPMTAKIASLTAFLGKRPLSLDYYRSAAMQDWVNVTVNQHRIKKAVVFSSVMAQFIERMPDLTRVIDFVDIDSDKWRQYADKKRFPMSWLYQREARCLLRYERRIAHECDASLFVSEAEAGLFQQLAPESMNKIGFFNNGVDTDYFSPGHTLDNPYQPQELVIVFTGAMDYWPNIDAVTWFAQSIFPAILSRHPEAVFCIVGSRPAEQVRALAQLPGVQVTGSVPDVRPYLAHARLAVAPLRIARGIQNKVLEAMAMAKTVVVSPQALEGIDAAIAKELILADDENAFANAVCIALDKPDIALEKAARLRVIARYNWDANLQKVDTALESI
ncbi:TIGR03087 family PEP-CTERM/XrtA system glycosyltransferase [Undibacterium sp. Jales W-56]|uniref:TIGR03087 family PEP-CTERM/XrtA system glycosyltransferase n=1 Tax=Undibacterium sp. Jales W-56 TaxID=2897325 RepID=UPI0021D1A8DE|nr:TIGR03087 family PEP-CTERM/XrtA system glycosyltransferase [Undibacterium sp. Jales W-56]MCU6434118.1 TIGR03087 family PEP-CTERM/XrtA system glycosyltransferase [Undibacterium sp. Jales W-56]